MLIVCYLCVVVCFLLFVFFVVCVFVCFFVICCALYFLKSLMLIDVYCLFNLVIIRVDFTLVILNIVCYLLYGCYLFVV